MGQIGLVIAISEAMADVCGTTTVSDMFQVVEFVL
jgi:hypothetical protein